MIKKYSSLFLSQDSIFEAYQTNVNITKDNIVRIMKKYIFMPNDDVNNDEIKKYIFLYKFVNLNMIKKIFKLIPLTGFYIISISN